MEGLQLKLHMYRLTTKGLSSVSRNRIRVVSSQATKGRPIDVGTERL